MVNNMGSRTPKTWFKLRLHGSYFMPQCLSFLTCSKEISNGLFLSGSGAAGA